MHLKQIRYLFGLYLIGYWLMFIQLPEDLFFFSKAAEIGASINMVRALISFAMLLSLGFTFDFAEKPMAVGVLIINIFVGYLSNHLMREVNYYYINWLLLYFILLPKKNKIENDWVRVPLLSLAASYSLSGITKLGFSEWNSGLVLSTFLTSGIPWSWAQDIFAHWNIGIFKIFSFLIMFFELIALPLSLSRYTVKIYWFTTTILQVSIAIITRINHISIMMIIFHFLIFDRSWLKKER